MKQEIIDRIKELGGNIDKVKGGSLQENLQSIEFKNPLYPHEFGELNFMLLTNFMQKIKNYIRRTKTVFIKI
jgi:hypothetical protein